MSSDVSPDDPFSLYVSPCPACPQKYKNINRNYNRKFWNSSPWKMLNSIKNVQKNSLIPEEAAALSVVFTVLYICMPINKKSNKI